MSIGKLHAFQSHCVKWLVLAMALAQPTTELIAAETITETFVAKATVIKGDTESSSRGYGLNYVSMPIICPKVYEGRVTALGSSTLTDANAGWNQSQWNGANGLHYIEFNSGAMVDIVETDSGSQSITVQGAFPASVQVGDSFSIRRHLTIADFFGANNEAGLQGGNNISEADTIQILDPETKGSVTIFYYPFAPNAGWYLNDYSPAGDTPIYPGQGLVIIRRSTQDLVIHNSGPAKEGNTQIPIYPGFNLLGTSQVQRDLMLEDLNIYTGNPSTGLSGGTNPGSADNITVISPVDGSTATYWYSTFSGNEGWYDSSFTPASDITIPPGSAFFVNRKSPGNLFTWNIPAE
jgi:hypothetical protein